MGDDLGDEWWLDEEKKYPNPSSDEGDEPVPGKPSKVKVGRAVPAKRTAETDPTDQKQVKRKRRTKQKISEYLTKSKPLPATGGEVIAKMEQFFKEKLSPIELEDIQLDESFFLHSNTSSLPLSSYLEEALPNWNRDLEAKRPRDPKTCLLLLVSASAKRAVDLNREGAAFKGKKCTSAKLFSKHMKIADQTKFLAKNRTQFAVGTPNRLTALLQQEALNLTGTRYLILDWNWRDVKFKRMCDIPELKADLFGLLEKYVIPEAKKGGKLKIGLF